MRANRSWRKARGALLALAVAATGAAVVVQAAPEASADVAGLGGDYVPLAGSTRVLDTGNGVGAPKAPIPAATAVTFQVTGIGRVPATGVRAVLVDITSKAPSGSTFFTVWPGDVATRPGTSNLNVVKDEQVSNSAVVQVGANGKLSLYNNAGTSHALVDVQGYFTTTTGASGPGGFVPTPTNPTVLTGPIAADATKTANVLGGVVPAGARAIFADVQVGSPTDAGYLSTVPTGATVTDSTLEFGTQTISHGAVIRLAADGRVDFRNHSTKQISVLVRVQGYFTATSTTGAGYRPLNKRLDIVTVPANNGIVDIAVGGTAGLPIKNIAGVALNFTANTSTANGYLKAWPLNSTEPTSSVNVYYTGKTRASLAILKPGFEGKIRLKNVGTSSVRVIPDIQGWFADPLPSIPPAQSAPSAVVQAKPVGTGLGSLEYSYVDNIGRLRLGHQQSPDNFSSIQWTTAESSNAYTGTPGISAYSDGRVQVTAQNSDGNYWVASQAAAGQGAYNPWSDIGGSMESSPTQITLSTGVTVNLGVDSDGKLWHHRLITGGSSSYWRSLTDQDLVGPLSYVPVDQGVQLFARDTSGSVRTALYANDGSMGVWTNLAATGVTAKPAAVVYPGNRTRVFVRAGDGTVQTKLQETNGTWPAAWQTVGTLNGNAFTTPGAPAAILDPVLGEVAVVARGADNEIYRVFETAQGSGTWDAWERVRPGESDPAVTDPVVAPVNTGQGQLWIIVFRNINDVTRVYDRSLSGLAVTAKSSKAAKNAAVPAFTGHSLPAPPVG